KLEWWFEQDIDDEGEEYKEGEGGSEVIEFSDSYEAPQQESTTASASEGSVKKKGRTVAFTTDDMQKRRNDIKTKFRIVFVVTQSFSRCYTLRLLYVAITLTQGSTSDETGKKKGRTVTLTTDDMQKRKNDVKARTTLLLSLPDEHQLRFSKYKTTQELWAAILKTFGGNETTKKTKKNLLKQQYGNFKAKGSETLEQALAPEWLMHTIVWRNRSDLDTMSLDDLYNHLKVYESEVQKKSEPNSHNMAFISSAKHSRGNEEVNTASVSTASTNVPTASVNIGVASISQGIACAYIASQSSSSQIKFEDINQIDEDDMEEMDIKWNIALLSMRADRAPRSQDRGRRDNYRQRSKVEEHAPKALMSIDGVRWDWSYMANDEENHALIADEETPTEFALMAKTSAESEVFDNSLCSKACKKNFDSLNSKITELTDKLCDAKNMIYHYKLALAQVESRLTEHRSRELRYCKKIRVFEFNTESRENCIKSLTKDLVLLKKEKGLPECVDDTVTDYSRPAPTIESSPDDAQNRNPSVIETEASPSTISPKPCIKFMKANDSPTKSKTDKAETAKKPPVKYAEQYKKPTKKPNVRGNQRNWNNLKSYQLGPTFVMEKKACFNCGDFNHLAYDCRKRGSSQNNIDDKRYWDRGCSRHKTCIISYLSDYEPFDGGYVSFGQRGCKITGKGTIKTECIVLGRNFKLSDDDNVLLRTPRQHNMYSIDLNNIVPHKDLTCLVAKASVDECMLWHKRLDNLRKFEAKGDEGYFIGYSMSSKAFRVFNKRTKGVKENLHVDFLENKAIEKGACLNWLFDIDSLTKSMNYVPVVAETSSSKPQDNCSSDVPESSGNSNPTATSTNPSADQMETLTVETPIPNVSSPVLTTCFTDSQKPSSDTRLILKRIANQVETPSLDNILTLTNWFDDILGVTTNSVDSDGVEADVSNMETIITASPTPTLKIHKDHPKSQIIGPVDTLIQTRNKSKEISDALQDPSWVEAMQEKLLQFKIQNVWTLVDCPKGVRPIETKWVLKNKKDERGIVIRNKAMLVAQRHTHEEGIDYDEVFAPVVRIEAIRFFLAYASFMAFTVYQMDVKSAFLYGTIDEEVYVMQPPRFQDPEFPARVYKVEKAMYGLHQAPRAWYGILSKYLLTNGFQRESEALMHEKIQMSAMGELNFFLGLQVLQKEDGIFLSQDKYMGDILKKFGYSDIRSANTPMDKENPWEKDRNEKDVDLHLYRSMIGSLMYLTASRPDIMFAVCACARHQVTPKECHLHAVKRIFRYLKGHPKLRLWYPKESPFDLVAYSDSDYGGATQDHKSTTGGCRFFDRMLISWQCKKQTIVATLTTEAEYVAAASCYGQVLWIQDQLLDYGYNFMNTKIYIDNNSAICIVKNHVYHSKTEHIDGIIYWRTSGSFIISFDLKSDKFGQVCLPERLPIPSSILEVVKVNESLGYDFWSSIYDDKIPTKQVSQDIMEEVLLNVDEAKLKKIADEMLRQRCTSGDEHQYHIDQMKNFLKSDIV
nr:hypothetical protein [Tanacetum cinerariifolium]